MDYTPRRIKILKVEKHVAHCEQCIFYAETMDGKAICTHPEIKYKFIDWVAFRKIISIPSWCLLPDKTE